MQFRDITLHIQDIPPADFRSHRELATEGSLSAAPMSSARRAAELAFAAPVVHVAPAQQPVIILRKRRTPALQPAGAATAPVGHDEEARSPRVFRAPAPLTVEAVELPESAPSNPADTSLSIEPNTASPSRGSVHRAFRRPSKVVRMVFPTPGAECVTPDAGAGVRLPEDEEELRGDSSRASARPHDDLLPPGSERLGLAASIEHLEATLADVAQLQSFDLLAMRTGPEWERLQRKVDAIAGRLQVSLRTRKV
jgi:hypothetical protein